jgi:N-acetyl-anhydromuramyl-L-alanine amidase AmpD
MELFSWAQDQVVKSALQAAIAGARVSQDSAAASINLLTKEGIAHMRRIVGDSFYTKNLPTNRHGKAWATDQPTGWVDHYTAALGARGTLMWFSNMDRGPNGGNSSSHYVVDRDGTAMTMVDPLTTVAWHATWSNPTHIGVEHVCTGLLRKSPEGKFIYLEKSLYPENLVPALQEVNGQLWEPFTVAQLLSNLAIKRLLIQALPTLQAGKFTDHQVIDPKGKVDCGPLWPMKELNKLAFSFTPLVEEMDWMKCALMTKEVVADFKAAVAALIP